MIVFEGSGQNVFVWHVLNEYIKIDKEKKKYRHTTGTYVRDRSDGQAYNQLILSLYYKQSKCINLKDLKFYNNRHKISTVLFQNDCI